ncbi:MAG: hypothetical protein RR869_10580 [Lachnospiraceae bacterium]
MNKTARILTIVFSITIFVGVLCTRFFKIEIEEKLTFFLIPLLYIGNFIFLFLTFVISVVCGLISKEKSNIFVWSPLFINILLQIVLFTGLTGERVEKMRFDLLIRHYENVVEQIENGSLIPDEGKIILTDNETHLRLAFNNEVLIIKSNGKIYAYFYTSTLMLNYSTGYLKQISLPKYTVKESTDIKTLEKYKEQWYKAATY